MKSGDISQFGEVYKFTKKNSDDLFAIKVIKKNFCQSLYKEIFFKNKREEINYMQKIMNKFSLKYIENVETKEFFNIVYEYYNTTL